MRRFAMGILDNDGINTHRSKNAKFLSESEVRYAMSHTKSCAAAARFLSVSYETFRKYAKQYIDSETGKSLFEMHKNQPGVGIPLAFSDRKSGHVYDINDILAGKYPSYSKYTLKRRLIKEGIFEEKCFRCGFNERRITDNKVPIIMDYIDGDDSNHLKENIRFLCYNCYYLEVGNLFGYNRTKEHDISYEYLRSL